MQDELDRALLSLGSDYSTSEIVIGVQSLDEGFCDRELFLDGLCADHLEHIIHGGQFIVSDLCTGVTRLFDSYCGSVMVYHRGHFKLLSQLN